MRLRVLMLAALCGAMMWGGYQASVLRAHSVSPVREVLAAAGGQPGFFAGADDKGGSSDNYRISALSVFSNVALHVKDNYVDPARIDPKEMLVGALNEIERQIAEVLVEDVGKGKLRVSVPGHEKLVTVADVESLWEINLKLREVFRFFEKHLPPQKEMRLVEYAAINGALSTLDPHSVLLKPEAFAEMKTSTKGEFGGLGIVISVRDGKLTIISPLDGTPASRAGLRAMDVISRIGDVSTVSMPIEEAVRMLRGPEGSKVTIWVERKAWGEPRKFTITRQRIKIESVESHLLDGAVGYIKIKNFQQNTGRDLDTHIGKLEKEAKRPLKGLVVDLRNNPGGLLEQAIKVSDKFLSSGDIVTTVGYGNKLREPKRAQWSTADLDIPLVVLVNNGSASASEIVAGALKNLDRAVIIGQRTFGKGSVQVLYDFADNSALKLTIAQYLTPGNVSIQNVGVTPDIALRPAWIDDKNVRLFYETSSHREKNLSKHLERAQAPGAATSAPVEAAPEMALSYLVDNKLDDEQAEGTEDEAPPEDLFETDFPIELGRDVLLHVGATSRQKTLKDGIAFLEKRKDAEQVRIKTAIEALGVDWSEGPTTGGSAQLASNLELSAEQKVTNTIAAGDEVQVTAKVTNNGLEPVHQIHGHLDTDHQAFRGREFLFGKIAPGETKTWSVTAKIPKEASSRSDIVKLQIRSTASDIEHTSEVPVTTKYVAHPQFSYSFSVDDTERGDGDGILEPGEGADFMVHVSNTGPGDADSVSLRLKSGAGEDLFLERGRAEIGALASGETKTGRLRFRIRKNQTPGKTDLPLELTIYDSATGEWLEDELAVRASPAEPDTFAKKATGGQLTADTVVRGGASTSAAVIATLKAGQRVKIDGSVKDFYRVPLSEDAFGWVAASVVKRASRPKKALDSLSHVPHRRPPSINLDGKLGGRVVESDSVVLSGNITGRVLRDMYVILNDEKVFYQAAPQQKAAGPAMPWAVPDEAAVKLDFRHELPLKEGMNKVLVVARLDEKIVTYRSLFVSRVQAAPTVAEAPSPKPARHVPTP